MREDKPPKEVVREMTGRDREAEHRQGKAGAAKVAAETAKVAAKKSGSTAARPRRERAAQDRRAEAVASRVRFTHPDRVYWADVGVTKQDLADYYTAVWDWMAPHVVNRPLALVRCPDGTKGQCFFQKHASAGLDRAAPASTVIDTNRRQIIAVEDSTACSRWCRPACSKSMCAAR